MVKPQDDLYSVTLEIDFGTVMTHSREEIRPPKAIHPNKDVLDTATSGDETNTAKRVEKDRNSSRSLYKDVTDINKRPHTNDVITVEIENNEFPKTLKDNSFSRLHQTSNEVSSMAALRQDAECFPYRNDVTEGNDGSSKVDFDTGKLHGRNDCTILFLSTYSGVSKVILSTKNIESDMIRLSTCFQASKQLSSDIMLEIRI